MSLAKYQHKNNFKYLGCDLDLSRDAAVKLFYMGQLKGHQVIFNVSGNQNGWRTPAFLKYESTENIVYKELPRAIFFKGLITPQEG